MSFAISPTIDQAKLQVFEKNFYKLAQQEDSKLLASPAVSYMPIQGTSYLSRMERTELVDVSGIRNPEKQYSQMQNDARRTTNSRYTKTFLVDSYDAMVQLITDPTSDLFMQLAYAKARTADRLIVSTASGSVTVGAPDTAGTVKTAAQDGVLTVDGTSSFTYANVITPVRRNFKNNELMTDGITLAISANEEYLLLQDDKFINNDYSQARPVDNGSLTTASGLQIVNFAGTDTGVIAVANPILGEVSGVRTNLALHPDAIGFAMEVGKLAAEKSATHVNSWEITIDVWFKAVRKEGVKVQLITSTI